MALRQDVQQTLDDVGFTAIYTHVSLPSSAPDDYSSSTWDGDARTSSDHQVKVAWTAFNSFRSGAGVRGESTGTLLMAAQDGFEPLVGDRISTDSGTKEYTVTDIATTLGSGADLGDTAGANDTGALLYELGVAAY